MLHAVITQTINLLAQAPNPGGGKAPPGSGDFETVLSWAAWIALGMCVLGVIVAGGAMALAHSGRHGGGEHAARLGWVLGGCIIVGSASGFVNAIV